MQFGMTLNTSSVHAGLGLFEYMQLAEELGAEPVWVVNNGVSHEESVPAGRIQSWVQDALDSIECGCWAPIFHFDACPNANGCSQRLFSCTSMSNHA